MPKLDRIIESALYVDDLDRARAFYTDVLQLKPILDADPLCAFDVGGDNVLLLLVKSKCVVYRSDRRVTAAGQAVNAAGSSCSSLGSVWLRERANTSRPR